MLGYIYHITNQINGKKYIGKTFDLKDRINKHYSGLKNNKHHCIKLQRAVNKYGLDNFHFTYKIHEIQNPQELSLLEIKEIDKYDSYKNGYNETLGGEGNKTVFNFEESVLIYQILQRYSGINRYIAKYYNCDHTVIDNLKNNTLYSNIDYDEKKLFELISLLKLSDDNLNENYKKHNARKLNEEKCLEILSIIKQKKGYDKTICEIFNINSKLIDRLKKNEIYKEYIEIYNNLSQEQQLQLMNDTILKYDIENKKCARGRNGVKNPLTQEQVNYILNNKDIKTRKQIGLDLNISSDRVSSVILGKSYKDLINNYYSSIK